MNMITTDEGRRENGGSDIVTLMFIVSQSVFPLISVLFKFCHACLYCLYTYNCNFYSSTGIVIYALAYALSPGSQYDTIAVHAVPRSVLLHTWVAA